jgi:hypothetical protein
MPEQKDTCGRKKDPGTCSEEQIRECHGDAATHSCETTGCEQDADPGECSPEQIRKCHGGAEGHPCAES